MSENLTLLRWDELELDEADDWGLSFYTVVAV